MNEAGDIELFIADGSFGGLTPSQLVVLQASGVSSTLAQIQRFPYAGLTSTVGKLGANGYAFYNPGTFLADFMQVYQAWLGGNPNEIDLAVDRLLSDHFDYRVVFGDPDFRQPAFDRVEQDDLWRIVATLPLKMAVAGAWDRPEKSLRSLWNYLIERLRANVPYSLMVYANPHSVAQLQRMMLPQLDTPRNIVLPLEPYVFRRDGKFRRIVFDGGDEFIIENILGLKYIAHLFKHVYIEFDPMELLQVVSGGQADLPIVSVTDEDAPQLGGSEASEQPLLDERAKREYADRLDEIEEEIERASASYRDDKELESKLLDLVKEKKSILKELESATGLGGKTRAIADSREKARQSVTKAISLAKQHIRPYSPGLFDHLESTVFTGSTCVYRPPKDVPWRF